MWIPLALGVAVSSVNLIIGTIIRAIDPKQNTALNPLNILTALTVGLSFLTVSLLSAKPALSALYQIADGCR